MSEHLGREAHHVGHLRDIRLTLVEQTLSSFHLDDADELHRRLTRDGHEFLVQMTACHSHSTTQLRYGIFRILHILLDQSNDMTDQFLVERAHGNLTGFDFYSCSHLVMHVLRPLQYLADT